jgi:thiol-disulfide isomerase/thioredoxin
MRSIQERGLWVGSVALEEGIIVPFRMNLDLGPKPSGYFLVGDEKTPIPEISRKGNDITLRFSEYGAEVRAHWDGEELLGEYIRIRSDGNRSFMIHGGPEFPGDWPATTTGIPDGNYQVVFDREGNSDDTTVAKFWTKDGQSYGTFIAPDGDYGLLLGRPLGEGFQFSRFTGWQAITIVIEKQAGVWAGKFYAASNAKPTPFVLKPNAEPGAGKQTTIKNPNGEFAFSGVTLSGETVRNTDDRFKGKALILDIMGTWCHNCLDEAPVLQKLYKRFGKDGLEVVGLSFEISDDPALAKKNLQLFKDRFGLTYTLLFCGSLDDANVDKKIKSQLDNFFAYPTAIFIDKNHKVRTVHSGFKGPATGDEFQQQIREFEDLAENLLR